MGGEGRQTLLNALFVANIGKYIFENAETGAVRGGNVKPRLPHQGQESDRFQRNCFAARIWSRDDQQVKIFSEPDIDRDDLFAVEQRVPAFTDINDALVVKDRHGCVHIHGKCGFCKDKIQFCQQFCVILDFRGVPCRACGKIRQNGGDLLLFLNFQLADFIVILDNGSRFDKQRRTGGGLVVNDSCDLTFIFRFDRNAVAVITHGDHGVL